MLENRWQFRPKIQTQKTSKRALMSLIIFLGLKHKSSLQECWLGNFHIYFTVMEILSGQSP